MRAGINYDSTSRFVHSCVLNISGYTGKERDAESGLDYFGARYFSSKMGRWMSPDWAPNPVPIPFGDPSNPQTLNLYGYAGNNPLSNIDIDGHQATATAECSGLICWLKHLFQGGSDPSPPPPSAEPPGPHGGSGTGSSPPVITWFQPLPGNIGLGYGGSAALGLAFPKGDNALMAGQLNVDAMNDSNGSALAATYGGTIPLGAPGDTHPSDPGSFGVAAYAGTSAHVTFGNGSLAHVRGSFHTITVNAAWYVEIGGFSYSFDDSGHRQVSINIPLTGPGFGLEATQYTTKTCMVGPGVTGC